MKITRWQIAIASICMITGLMLTVTLQAQGNKSNPTSQRSENLASIAEKTQNEVATLEKEIADLRKELAKKQESVVLGNSDELTLLQTELQKAKFEAGLTPVTGPGLIFTIDDRNEALKQDLALAQKNGEPIDYWLYLVHDSYLINIVNDLRISGAEAISINGERLVSTSDIKCGGYIVLVNGQQLSAPYTIEAIGSFDRLKKGIENGYTFDIITGNMYPIKITESKKLLLPAYSSGYNLKYALTNDNKKEGGN